MNKYILILILNLFSIPLAAQVVKGIVTTEDKEPLIGASIRVANSSKGFITNIGGRFAVELDPHERVLYISFIGYVSDTVNADFRNPMNIVLKESTDHLDDVVIKSEGSTFVDNLQPILNETILETELQKAACCNLSESFETNASVDVSFTDAVSGAKMIRMLGLDGRYVQINREGIPHVRGLNGRYGLSFVPGTWMQSIDVGKGTGSVVNGYESMIGQINVEFKKPEIAEKLYLNGYVNSLGRAELNANYAEDINDKWSSGILIHSHTFSNDVDRNDDGFVDLVKSRQINLLSRFKYSGEKVDSQIGINFMRDEKAGGQVGFGFGDDHASSPYYGFSMNTTRLELFGKTGLLFPAKPYKGWGFVYSASLFEMNGGFGRSLYQGKEFTTYLNAINQNIIRNSAHQYKTGATLLIDLYDEFYQNLDLSRNEIVPGAYFEYSFIPNEEFTLVAGGRLDHHNLFGTYWTPRLHARYQSGENTTWRMSVGKGYRTPNALMDNMQVLVSSRQVNLLEDIEPEVSWNAGASLSSTIQLGKPVELIMDYFYTNFQNQLIADRDADFSQVLLYNLKGKSYAHSYQVQLSSEPTENLSLRAAYKYYDVKTTIDDRVMAPPFVSKNRIFLNAEYATKFDKWKVDATWQWMGQGRFPDMSANDGPARAFADNSPAFSLINTQISRGFRWGNIYMGAENLLDFRQKNPIVDPENPFGNTFDASLVWGPIAGRVVYAGFRYKIKN
ncbi:MAG: TonB-dependent receptor [Cyclobacteriaceae bacterium]